MPRKRSSVLVGLGDADGALVAGRHPEESPGHQPSGRCSGEHRPRRLTSFGPPAASITSATAESTSRAFTGHDGDPTRAGDRRDRRARGGRGARQLRDVLRADAPAAVRRALPRDRGTAARRTTGNRARVGPGSRPTAAMAARNSLRLASTARRSAPARRSASLRASRTRTTSAPATSSGRT